MGTRPGMGGLPGADVLDPDSYSSSACCHERTLSPMLWFPLQRESVPKLSLPTLGSCPILPEASLHPTVLCCAPTAPLLPSFPPPRPARSSVASTFNQGQPPGSREGPGWGPGRDWGLGWGQGAAPPPPRVFFLSYITSCSPSPSQRTGLMSLSGATPGKVSQPSGFPGNKSNSEKRGTAGARAKVKWGQ